ncbi:MAG: chromate transporter [Thermovenabulum sp.]|uniref:chromate transporter n=1 Tax=Thermovenabulum sp. TaxID=3100335 RepID=UPI003C7A2D2A
MVSLSKDFIFLLKMFFTFFKIGAFTLGGGYAMIPLMKVEIVEKNKWLKEEEFIDIIAVSQSVPGAVAINTSVYIGYKLRRFIGAVFALFGTVLPSFLSILIIAYFYKEVKKITYFNRALKGVYPSILVLILCAAFSLWKKALKDYTSYVIFIISFILLFFFNLYPGILILLFGIFGIIKGSYENWKREKEYD